MKKLILIISSTVLLTLFSGCEGKNFGLSNLSMPKLSVPTLDLNNLKLDRTLPTVKDLKIESSLSEVALEWKPVRLPHIAGYRIFRNNDEGGYSLIATIPDPYAAHYTDINKRQYKYNRYMVSLYTDDGRVSMPVKISIKKRVKPLQAVPYVNAVSGLPNRVKILWRIDPDPRVTGYIIQRYDPLTKTWHSIHQVDKRLSVEYIDRDVKPGVKYQYRVIAKNEDGVVSIPSKIVSASPKSLPPRVIGVMATTNLPRKIEIIWKKSPQADIDHYNIYASSFVDSLYTLIAKTKATNYTDRFDEDGKIRFYSITAVDRDGLESLKSKPAKGMTLPSLLPPKIISARIVANRVELKWQARDKRAVSYNIYKSYWDSWRVKKIKVKGFNGTTFVDPKIRANTTYTYYVTAVDKNGIESAKSRSVEVQVEGISQKSKSWF